MEPKYESVPIEDAAGDVGRIQIAIGALVLVWALWVALRPPRTHRPWLFLSLLAGAFLPVILGHAVMLVTQIRVLGETSGMDPAASQDRLVHGMESATVHTWIGWAVSGVLFVIVLLVRLRLPAPVEPNDE